MRVPHNDCKPEVDISFTSFRAIIILTCYDVIRNQIEFTGIIILLIIRAFKSNSILQNMTANQSLPMQHDTITSRCKTSFIRPLVTLKILGF